MKIFIHKIIFIVIVFFTIVSYSQDLERIKKSDTLYIIFKRNIESQIIHSSSEKDNQYYERIKGFLEDSTEANKVEEKVVYTFVIDAFMSYLFQYKNITIIKKKSFLDKIKIY